MRSTLATLTKQTMGRVRRRTSTKQRSMTLVVRSFLHKCAGKANTESSSGRSRSNWRTIAPYFPRQRARKARNAASAWPRSCGFSYRDPHSPTAKGARPAQAHTATCSEIDGTSRPGSTAIDGWGFWMIDANRKSYREAWHLLGDCAEDENKGIDIQGCAEEFSAEWIE